MAFIKMVPQFMRRFLRSSTKPAASRNRPLRAVPTTASQFAPVWGRAAGAAAAASGSAFCATFCAVAVVSAAGVSAGAVPSCAGASGVTAGSAGVTSGVDGTSGCVGGVRLVGRVRRVRSFRGAGRVRFTGFRGQFGQHHMLGLAALVNAADVVCIAVLFQQWALRPCPPASSRAGPRPPALVVSMLGFSSMYLRLWTVW